MYSSHNTRNTGSNTQIIKTVHHTFFLLLAQPYLEFKGYLFKYYYFSDCKCASQYFLTFSCGFFFFFFIFNYLSSLASFQAYLFSIYTYIYTVQIKRKKFQPSHRLLGMWLSEIGLCPAVFRRSVGHSYVFLSGVALLE